MVGYRFLKKPGATYSGVERIPLENLHIKIFRLFFNN